MWPFPARRNTTGRAFVASAQRVRTTQADGDRGKYQRLIMPWQQAVLGYYDTLGECWYPAQFYGRALSQIDLFVARRDGDEIVPVENDTAQQILDRVRDPGGNGRSNLLRTYGQLTFLIGVAGPNRAGAGIHDKQGPAQRDAPEPSPICIAQCSQIRGGAGGIGILRCRRCSEAERNKEYETAHFPR